MSRETLRTQGQKHDAKQKENLKAVIKSLHKRPEVWALMVSEYIISLQEWFSSACHWNNTQIHKDVVEIKLNLVFGGFILGLKKKSRKVCKLDCLFSIVSATSIVAEKLNIQDHSLRLWHVP